MYCILKIIDTSWNPFLFFVILQLLCTVTKDTIEHWHVFIWHYDSCWSNFNLKFQRFLDIFLVGSHTTWEGSHYMGRVTLYMATSGYLNNLNSDTITQPTIIMMPHTVYSFIRYRNLLFYQGSYVTWSIQRRPVLYNAHAPWKSNSQLIFCIFHIS